MRTARVAGVYNDIHKGPGYRGHGVRHVGSVRRVDDSMVARIPPIQKNDFGFLIPEGISGSTWLIPECAVDGVLLKRSARWWFGALLLVYLHGEVLACCQAMQR